MRRLAEGLGAQGLAWVQPVRPGATEVRLALLTPGSTEPDEITVILDQPDSVKQALDRLQTPLVLTRGSLGATVIDVLDLKGAIVMEVDAGQAAAEAGLAPGDLVQQLDGQPVESALDLESKLGSRQPGQQVSLGVRTRDRPDQVVAGRPSTGAGAGDVERPLPAGQRHRGGAARADGDAPPTRPSSPSSGSTWRRRCCGRATRPRRWPC